MDIKAETLLFLRMLSFAISIKDQSHLHSSNFIIILEGLVTKVLCRVEKHTLLPRGYQILTTSFLYSPGKRRLFVYWGKNRLR